MQLTSKLPACSTTHTWTTTVGDLVREQHGGVVRWHRSGHAASPRRQEGPPGRIWTTSHAAISPVPVQGDAPERIALCEQRPQYSALGTSSWRRMGELHRLSHNELLRAGQRIVFCLVEKLRIYFSSVWDSQGF